MRNVIVTLIQALEANREQILCQVVETRGSTPQKAGSIMVVDPAGGQTGTLGGGCVENEVKQRAIRQLGEAGAILQSFVLDHDHAWADGLICGGKMVISIEALHGPAPLSYFRTMLRLLDAGLGVSEAVIVNPERVGAGQTGQRFLFGPDATCQASWPEGPVPEPLAVQAVPRKNVPGRKCRGGWPGFRRCPGSGW